MPGESATLQQKCLMAGTFAPAPAFVQIRVRRTQKGGSHVAVLRRAGA